LLDPGLGFAAVGGTRVAVVYQRRGAGRADCSGVAQLRAVAGVGIAAAGAGSEGNMGDAGGRGAAVGGARVAVVDEWWRACLANAAGVAQLGPVALVGVAAARPRRGWGVDGLAGAVACVFGARVAVVGGGAGAGAQGEAIEIVSAVARRRIDGDRELEIAVIACKRCPDPGGDRELGARELTGVLQRLRAERDLVDALRGCVDIEPRIAEPALWRSASRSNPGS
jgi:hypothetical protein